MIIRVGEHAPALAPDSFVAPSADVIGQVEVGSRSSVWYLAVLRGDQNLIRIGAETNVQDGTVIHNDPPEFPGYVVDIGDRVTIGHGARLHGCRIGSHCLIGAGAILMDGARVGDHCIVAAGALLPPHFEVPAGRLAVGAPARVARELKDQERVLIERAADIYVARIRDHAGAVEVPAPSPPGASRAEARRA